jgi:Mg-chelatase subunit ChlD
MPTRQRIVSYGIPTAAAATIIAAASLTPWSGQRPRQIVQQQQLGNGKAVDIVFAVDTTGSMAEEIDAAKRTIFAIANTIRATQQNADLRIGLVAYKDTDADSTYVTKPFALTRDLDAVYAELASYTAAGGDDFPELVTIAMSDAIEMQWRPDATKLMFLVGDAWPAVRPGVPTYDTVTRLARERGITVNAIQSDDKAETARTFQQIASLGGGEFSVIPKDGGVQQIATPYDDKMAELSATIDSTTVIIGTDGARDAYRTKMEAAQAAPAPSKADRAGYYAKPGTVRADDDLVEGYASGSASVESLDPAALPADMRGKDKGEIKAELERRVQTRKQAQKQIEQLAKERDEYLKKHGPGDGFDAKVKATVEKQLNQFPDKR